MKVKANGKGYVMSLLQGLTSVCKSVGKCKSVSESDKIW